MVTRKVQCVLYVGGANGEPLKPLDAAIHERTKPGTQFAPLCVDVQDSLPQDANLSLATGLTEPTSHVRVTTSEVKRAMALVICSHLPSDAVNAGSEETPPQADNEHLPPEADILALAQEKCQAAQVKAWLIEQYAIRNVGTFKNLPTAIAHDQIAREVRHRLM